MTDSSKFRPLKERIQALKERLPLKRFIEDMGFALRHNSGDDWVCLCPFHTEKTPSFHVAEKRNTYHCFGCGARGDVVDFVENHRGCSRLEAVEILERETPGMPVFSNKPLYKTPPVPTATPEPLKELVLRQWQQACQSLLENEAEIQRLATWRGFHPDTLRGAASAGLMAKWAYFGTSREAFLVLAPPAFFKAESVAQRAESQQNPSASDSPPSSLRSTLIPHAIHCRLAGHSPGNDHAKQSWRYDPKGSKAWPFVWGNPFGARFLFVSEGQWDALAIADLCGWHRPESMPPRTCIIGLRGATSWKLILHPEHGFPLDPAAEVIAVHDADTAGAGWFDKDGFLDQLRPRVARVVTFGPTQPGCKDFNDLTKAGLITGAEFLSFVKAKLRHHPFARPKAAAPTFLQWCRTIALGEGEPARAARLVINDPTHPQGRKSPTYWRTHWKSLDLTATDHCALLDLLDLYQQAHNPPKA